MPGGERFASLPFSTVTRQPIDAATDGDPRPKTESEIRRERIGRNLAILYDKKTPGEIAVLQQRIFGIIDKRGAEFREAEFPEQPVGFSQKDAFVITYPNSLSRKGEKPLDTFEAFYDEYLSGVFNGVHHLPDMEHSELDRGFSVMDHYKIKEEYGTWENTKRLAKKGVRVIKDFLVNHASMKGKWFQEGEIQGKKPYKGYFESYAADDDPRPRFIDNFTPRPTPNFTFIEEAGRWYRTTFGDGNTTDQADFDYHNPELLIQMLDVALFYKTQGANGLRMDSMAFAWKEPGGKGIHEPKVTPLLQIFRDVTDEIDPSNRLLAENNVPQDQNIYYLGKKEEPLAHMVYNFGLSPLMLHAVYTEQVDDLREWLRAQPDLPPNTVLVNHVACHDGVFLQEAKAYFDKKDEGKPDNEKGKDMQKLFDGIESRGGVLAKRKSPRGEESVYELDTTWMSALSHEDEDPEIARRKLVSTYALAAALGMPAMYILSLVGKRNDKEAYAKTGKPRDLLRTNMDYDELRNALNDPKSEEHKNFQALMSMLSVRVSHPAFDPTQRAEIIKRDELQEFVKGSENSTKSNVIGVRNKSEAGDVLSLHNFSSDTVTVNYQGMQTSLEPFEYKWIALPNEKKNESVVYSAPSK